MRRLTTRSTPGRPTDMKAPSHWLAGAVEPTAATGTSTPRLNLRSRDISNEEATVPDAMERHRASEAAVTEGVKSRKVPGSTPKVTAGAPRRPTVPVSTTSTASTPLSLVRAWSWGALTAAGRVTMALGLCSGPTGATVAAGALVVVVVARITGRAALDPALRALTAWPPGRSAAAGRAPLRATGVAVVWCNWWATTVTARAPITIWASTMRTTSRLGAAASPGTLPGPRLTPIGMPRSTQSHFRFVKGRIHTCLQ